MNVTIVLWLYAGACRVAASAHCLRARGISPGAYLFKLLNE
jgi:hypothetical protein